MNKYLNSSIGRLRLIAFLEGISLLTLLFIAMPLKYMANLPLYTTIVGTIHGILFILYVVMAFNYSQEAKWKFFNVTLLVLLSSVIPFGTFYIDHKILKPIHEQLK